MTTYSSMWFDIFLDQVPEEQTEREVRFLNRMLPSTKDRQHILDICCGAGRHAVALGKLGYKVTGIDSNLLALQRTKKSSGVTFLQWDMRNVEALNRTFDAVINLWASFGYFDHQMNRDILRQIHTILKPSGVFVLDVYNNLTLAKTLR
jgi:SAM-dependent methyltransferase